ncbi:hypothetical protein BU15DRAFT_89738 [Melanogaster broomeanus]|nr:hypothetical protein BU15DRAFT_89738 [Melanogaster broomeanus]
MTPGNGNTVRHPDLWFSDGSIVLRAEHTLFRVHKSLLARHSDTPLVQPSGDIEGYVAHLLTALVDGPNFGNNDLADFEVVSGILRLATKYLVDSLREKALDHLAVAWPTTLKGWDAREDIARSLELQTGSGAYPYPTVVINLAREVNAPSLLPSAFYDLSRYHFSQLYDQDSGWQCPLSSADMQRLALGKEASQHAITTLIQSMGSHAHSLSRKSLRISRSFVALATQHYLFDHERGCTDPLYVAEELGQPLNLEQAECQACAKSLEAWAKRERERMWKMIPLWFRLDV